MIAFVSQFFQRLLWRQVNQQWDWGWMPVAIEKSGRNYENLGWNYRLHSPVKCSFWEETLLIEDKQVAYLWEKRRPPTWISYPTWFSLDIKNKCSLDVFCFGHKVFFLKSSCFSMTEIECPPHHRLVQLFTASIFCSHLSLFTLWVSQDWKPHHGTKSDMNKEIKPKKHVILFTVTFTTLNW